MLKISSNITVELASGQTISMSLDESKQLVDGLSRFIEDYNNNSSSIARLEKQRGPKNALRTYVMQKRKIAGMSELKKNEILKHVNKKLSSKPRTLSYLLNGISYIPNHLPMIRLLVENEPSVSRKIIGKRTYYFVKDANSVKLERPKVVAAAS